MAEDEQPKTQERFKRLPPVAQDGSTQFIPLSSLVGGQVQVHEVETEGIKRLERSSAPAPRGWYKDKHVPKNVRPRPCYSEAVLSTPYSGMCNVGCSFCCPAGTLVATSSGQIPIERLKVGDEVCGGSIKAIRIHRANRLYRVGFNDGSKLKVTGEHPIFVFGVGWVEAQRLEAGDEVSALQILSDPNTKIMEDSLQLGSLSPKGKTRSAKDRALLPLSQMHEGDSETSRLCGTATRSHERTDRTGGESGEGQTEIRFLETSNDRAAIQEQESGLESPTLPWRLSSVSLGVSDRPLVGSERVGMAFRREGLSTGQAQLVPAGLPHLLSRTFDFDRRGQRLLGTGAGEADPSSYERAPLPGLGRPHLETTRRVVSLEAIEGAVEVWDIETSSGVFYAEGVLVHNCYINMGTRGYKATMLPTVNADYPEKMDKQVAKMRITGAAYMSSYTEPFQEKMEELYHVTERLSRVFMKHNVPIFYLSRKIPPPWAEEALLSNPYSYMQWSVNTSNPEDLRRLSPGIFKLDALLKHIEHFASLGIYMSFQVNPVLPGITTQEELLELVRILAQAGANHVIIKFIEISPANKKVLFERLRATKGLDGVDEFESIFTDHFGHQCYVRQDLRVAWLKSVLELTRSLGITMSTCYEYYNNGMSGASMAPWFVTADQCHGPAVPVHFRPKLGEPFQALPGCYRKGCLYCADFGTKSCRNDRLQAASALTYKDYREIDLAGHEDMLEDWLLPESAPPPERAHERGKNPGLQTDAELWGLPPLDDVLANPEIAMEPLGCGAGCTCQIGK